MVKVKPITGLGLTIGCRASMRGRPLKARKEGRDGQGKTKARLGIRKRRHLKKKGRSSNELTTPDVNPTSDGSAPA